MSPAKQYESTLKNKDIMMLLDVAAIKIAAPPAALREVASAPALMRALHLSVIYNS